MAVRLSGCPAHVVLHLHTSSCTCLTSAPVLQQQTCVPTRPAGARFILVVEKDAVFQSLVESRLHEQLPCVIITGGGWQPVIGLGWERQLVL